MSATRVSLLAAAVVVALTPADPCRAQAYGASQIVEHNDLRWFEPVELDIDGQMPHRDAGWFGSFDKLFEATSVGRLEIGHQGLTVDSERIYQAPSNELAFTALEQVEDFAFVGNLEETLAYSGIRFEVADTRGTTSLTDDIETPFATNTFATVDQLATAIRAFNLDANNIAANRQIRVAGEPTPYQVRNSIRDALPDAGFAWGERYEFGYSDGEQGWMISILDGPESTAGGTWGAGEASPFTSQSGTEVFGPDPFFLSDLQDDDGDGRGDGDGELGSPDLFALGFGSVAVNFNLPTPDFLAGYRDYFDNSVGASGGTTTGPILYVGNYGTVETDLNVIGVTFPTGGTGGTIDLNAAAPIAQTTIFQTEQAVADPNEGLLQSTIITIQGQLNLLNQQLTIGIGQDDDDEAAFLAAIGVLQGTQTAATALQNALNTQIATAPDNMVLQNQFAALTANLNAQLLLLDAALDPLFITVDGAGAGGAGATVAATEENRLADDIDGNGQAGVVRVLADIDGDGTIEAGEIIAIINNFGDLHTFNVFFDQVTVRNTTEMDGVELMRTHQLSTRHKLEQGRWDNLRLSYGLRFLSVKDDFFFQGLGSILGRTTVETDVENQIIGPQLGLQWVRNDGPWSFIVEGRGTLGYNIVDVDQYGIFGEEAIPGALNRSATARTTTSVDGTQFEEFSPLGELRAMLRYRLADSVSLQAGYTGRYLGNVHRGGQATAWNAPDFGIHDHKGEIFTNGLSFGVELRH